MESIVPSKAGLTDQNTPGLLAFRTVAVNCCDWLTYRVAAVGATLMVTGGNSKMVAVPTVEPSVGLDAVTVTDCCAAMLDGAV